MAHNSIIRIKIQYNTETKFTCFVIEFIAFNLFYPLPLPFREKQGINFDKCNNSLNHSEWRRFRIGYAAFQEEIDGIWLIWEPRLREIVAKLSSPTSHVILSSCRESGIKYEANYAKCPKFRGMQRALKFLIENRIKFSQYPD